MKSTISSKQTTAEVLELVKFSSTTASKDIFTTTTIINKKMKKKKNFLSSGKENAFRLVNNWNLPRNCPYWIGSQQKCNLIYKQVKYDIGTYSKSVFIALSDVNRKVW